MTEADEINSEKMEKSFEEDLPYEGLGTDESPFVVSWKDGDTENPYNWSNLQRYTILAGLASAMLCELSCSYFATASYDFWR